MNTLTQCTVRLVGPRGAGKTTVAKLLREWMAFQEFCSGAEPLTIVDSADGEGLPMLVLAADTLVPAALPGESFVVVLNERAGRCFAALRQSPIWPNLACSPIIRIPALPGSSCEMGLAAYLGSVVPPPDMVRRPMPGDPYAPVRDVFQSFDLVSSLFGPGYGPVNYAALPAFCTLRYQQWLRQR